MIQPRAELHRAADVLEERLRVADSLRKARPTVTVRRATPTAAPRSPSTPTPDSPEAPIAPQAAAVRDSVDLVIAGVA
jgi:hypothetical protein